MKSILVIGMGRFGQHLCENLGKLDNQIMAVDMQEERLEPVLPYVASAKIGDCTNELVLKSLGVEERSIQTSSYGLDPIYNWNSDTREITGYEMNTQLTVSDIPIGEAGSIMSQSVVAGVNSIDNVSYFCSTYDESYQEALKKAIEMAKGKASAMAEASGRTLGEVSNVEEYGYNPYTRYTGYMSGGARNEMAMETTAAAMDMGVMAGEISVEAQVSVTFNLQ